MSLDIGPAIRTALIEEVPISAELSQWRGEPAVFTRRPVPEDAEDMMILVNPDVSITDADGLTSDRPIVVRDIIVYGRKGAPGSAEDQTREVEAAAYRIRELFHRQKFSLRPVGFSVIGITATGPISAPTDDESTVARAVTITVRLRRVI